MQTAVAATVTLTIGFLAGLLTFRQKQRWCPTCGSTLVCAIHHPPADHPRERRPRDVSTNAPPASARRSTATRNQSPPTDVTLAMATDVTRWATDRATVQRVAAALRRAAT